MSATIVSARLRAGALVVLLAGLAATVGGSPARAAPPGSPWGAGYFPNVELVTQEGNTVRFYDDLIKDKVVAINFIYTRCTDSCPMETAALRKVQQAIGDRVGSDVFFYSISIDGDRDHPQELKDYATRFKAGPGWTFLTGRKDDVTLLRQKLGLYRGDGKAEQSLGEHNINLILGNERTGQWIKRSPFEETAALVRILEERLPGYRVAKAHLAGNAEVPAAVPQTPAEKLFQSQCANCHSLGTDNDLGPGLAGVVQRRDRAWLKRWLKAPDRMIAEKDPTALALYQQYQRIPMPNLKLSDRDIETLIALMAHHRADNANTAKP